MHLGSVDLHAELELLADSFDVLEALLIVGTGSSDPDIDLVLNENGGEFSEGADHSLES